MTAGSPADTPERLFERAGNGDRAATARLLSIVERGGDPARRLGALVGPLAGGGYTVGITGAPGAGKSTLTSAVVAHLRAAGEPVAVLAVDPSSPFTGGAILGDRVRMQDHAVDDGVFIRSMATRGHLGGLALATPEAVRLLEALGHRLVLIETVGVGQVEVDIAGKADTTVVVVNPGWGDTVQANKAGLLEVADVFVINKSDRPGAAQTRRDLDQMLDLAGVAEYPTHESPHTWRPPIVETVATDGKGAETLWQAVTTHREHAAASGLLDRRREARRADELAEIVGRRLQQRARRLYGEQRWDATAAAVRAGTLDPWAAADDLLAALDPPR